MTELELHRPEYCFSYQDHPNILQTAAAQPKVWIFCSYQGIQLFDPRFQTSCTG